MARSKPNKPLKSPNKQQTKNKTNNTQSLTPQTMKTNTKTTWTEATNEQTEKRDIPQEQYERNPENIPHYETDKIHRRINRKDWHKQKFDEDGEVIDSSDEGFQQPSDEDAQGNVLTEEELALTKMNDSHRTPNKQDAKSAAEPEYQETLPSPEPNLRRLRKQEHENEQMKKLFETFTENTQKQLREQGEKHAMEITAMKRAGMDTQNLLTTKTTPAQTMNDHRISAHFTEMTNHMRFSSTEHLETGRNSNITFWQKPKTQPSDGIRKSPTTNQWMEHQNRSTSSKDTLISLKTLYNPY
jgi:hypothetical protein